MQQPTTFRESDILYLRISKCRMNKVYSNKDKPRMVGKLHAAQTSFSIEAYTPITIASCNE